MERSNPWWRNEADPTVEGWSRLRVGWVPHELQQFSLVPLSLNFLSGPRQVGKTTAIKLLVDDLIARKKTDPRSIFYLSCDELTDFKELGEVLDSYIRMKDSWKVQTSYIFLDEVAFVEDWWRAVKARIDGGIFSRDVVTVTGSASLDLLKQREYFPGRRGMGVDLIMRPLGFASYTKVLGKIMPQNLEHLADSERTISANRMYGGTLGSLFSNYLETGGFPLVIREKAELGSVSENSRKVLLDGLRGDWLRARRSEKFMKEVISYILSSKGTPISWLGISKSTSIGSPNTARACAETLQDLLLTLELEFISPDNRVFHRKNRKVHFTDPFIYNVLSEYSRVEVDAAAVVEATVASHLARNYEVYYWRNRSEVDLITLDKEERSLKEKGKGEKQQYGFEIKWGFKTGRKPRHIRHYISLNWETVPAFLASLPFG